MRVTEKMLIEKARQLEEMLMNDGMNVEIRSYFAYGMYSFYFNYKDENGNDTQKQTDMGTKKECWESLDKLYYKMYYLKNKGWVQIEGGAEC